MITSEEESYLLRSIDLGEAVLVLGAGASASSKNAAGESIRQAGALAALLSERAGLPYAGETLWEVLGAVRGPILSQDQILALLAKEYRGTSPSTELTGLFRYVWKRVYTWNIDDTLENAHIRGAQVRRHKNGLRDKVSDAEGEGFVQVIHLHGQITAPEHGLVLTEEEYNRVIIGDSHEWYRQAAQDYISGTPIFIGSRLKEPILSLELDRARRSAGESLGKAFLVSPDNYSAVQESNLKSRNIVHIKSTSDEFFRWLDGMRPGGVSSNSVISKRNSFAGAVSSELGLKAEDLDTAKAIFPIRYDHCIGRISALPIESYSALARRFLEGYPPTWDIAASDIPAWLTNTESLFNSLSQSILRRDRLFVVHGQSGSGKTTATMQALLRFQKERPEIPLYEIRGEVRSLRSAFWLLQKVHPDGQIVVFVGDAFLFGDSLSEDILDLSSGRITLVAGSRSGEWQDHHQRHLGAIATPFRYERFVSKDYQPLIDRLLKFVPAPRLNRLTPEGRREQMARSKAQLLIAMREATDSQKFADLITNEFQSLPDDDVRSFVIIASLATMARLGVRPEVAREAYEKVRAHRSYEACEAAAAGIVFEMNDGRLHARHELYVRHIVENVVDVEVIINVVIEMLRTYTKYEIPIVKSVSRRDGHLFRYLINHNVLGDMCIRRGVPDAALKVYKSFEVEFQLDGQYWLQYGQYLSRRGNLEQALEMLRRSIQAYPNNPFAVHALADLQLKVAERRLVFDTVTVELIGDAVKTLQSMDASIDLDMDQYPIVTLSTGHVAALVKHGQAETAKQFARGYFERIQHMQKRNPTPALQHAKERLAHFITSNLWDGGKRGGARPRRR